MARSVNILVTGSTGFIGSQLCQALCERGHTVRAFHRPTSTLRMLEDLPVEHALGDLTHPETLEAAMQGIEVVFHAAALLGASDQNARLYATTVEGTRSVLQAALQAGVQRVIHTSSVAALGVPEQGLKYRLPLDENHSWNYNPQRWPYGYAKYLAELEVQKAVAHGLDVVIVNPSVVLGAGDIYRQGSSIIMQVARRRVTALVEGGANMVHIQDVVAGHLAAMEHGRTGQRYILGGENLTHVQLVQKISVVTGGSVPALVLPAGVARALIGPLRLAKPFLDLPITYQMLYLAGYHFYYDSTKAQVELGLNAPTPVSRAIKEAYDWFVSMGAAQAASAPLY